MNIDELQKINALTKELQKHGIAASSQEASKKAQQIMQEQKETPTPQQATPTPEPKIDYFTQKKIELLLQMSTKKMQAEINTLQHTVSALSINLEKVKADIIAMKRTSVQVPQIPKQETKAPAAPAPKSTQKSHPRQGKFTSDDVDLKKMFYYGR